ncbi:MAG: hypothetical protein JRG97_00420 [Deltaproteobacteria bacterium]|nr:hypothetical protein [Deltaproteobacteria bacterium]MBW2139520.1 hypothetical protein [Deltaproteobacteria bacterium]
MMLFLDPKKPLQTCVSENCDDCAVKEAVHCHFRPKDLLHFLSIALPPFLLGGAGIYFISWWLLALWIALIIGFFGFLEIRVMCSHCPHYAEPGGSLKCWANYGSPKLWKYRPGPMSFMEKFLFFAGFAVIWGYPLIFLIKGTQWFLLIVYIISTIGFFMTLKIALCTQCMNFACPLNSVDEDVRREFFKQNPDIARAWGRGGDADFKPEK